MLGVEVCFAQSAIVWAMVKKYGSSDCTETHVLRGKEKRVGNLRAIPSFISLDQRSVHAQSHHLDIGARLKWGEQGPCMCQKVEKLAKKSER